MINNCEFDAIVVGSGAAGGWAAKELTEGGMRVLLLEAGRNIDPIEDFPQPNKAGHHLAVGNPLVARSKAALLGGQFVQARCIAFSHLTQQFFVNDRENPYTTPPDKPFNWYRGRQVGGKLYLWGRIVFRMSDDDFKAASRDGHGTDWPISYSDLAPHYDKVETFLGVNGTLEGIPGLPDGKYAKATTLNAPEKKFRALVGQAFPSARIIPTRFVANNLSRIPLPIRAAQETGLLTLRTDAIVEALDINEATGRATGVRYIDRITRQARSVRAKFVILCAGSIETLRILMNSRCNCHPNGVGNTSGRLGQNFMDAVHIALTGPHEDVEAQTPADQTDAFDFGKIGGFYVPPFRAQEPVAGPYLRGFGIMGGIGRGYPFWHLTAQGEMLPRPQNKVTLDPYKRDAWGIPAAHVDVTYSENEERMVADALATMKRMAAVAGLEPKATPIGKPLHNLAFKIMRKRLVMKSGASIPGSAIHEVGGAPMGTEAKNSVLDPYNRCWDADNVFVTDGACFVSSGAQNTTLTIMALTVRACAHIIKTHRASSLGYEADQTAA
ncbi:GMC oxidoreductase [Methylobacterium sp. ID0610]|uniref:GMC oxidoreductase n=1 Tax=Methylobacterium carpenticola TaxID=3344827 RepID=UPI00368CD44A